MTLKNGPAEEASTNPIQDYINGVLDETIPVGRWVYLAVKRHVADLEKDWEYYWDEEKALHAVNAFPALFNHTIGSYAGQPFHLAPWQAFIVGSIWGWRRKSDDTRRFRRVYVTLARKNGKSTLAAGIAILLAQFDGERAAQVFIGATKIDQAKLIFAEAGRMIGAKKELRDMADRRVLQINFDSTDSFIRPLGSDRAFDGLNPSGIIFDELHAWREQHRPFYDTLTTGSASRSQPLRFTITTAGDSNSLIWKEEETVIRNLLEGKYEEESYFGFLATMDKDDDPFDEDVWYKSMPNLGVSVSREYVREQMREAQVSPAAKNRFKRYFSNIEVAATEQAIDIDKWDACAGTLSDWSMAESVVAAVDAGGRNDLASIAYVAKFYDGCDDKDEHQYRYEVRTVNFMDTDTSRDLNEMPWLSFVDSKLLSVVPQVHTAMFEELSRGDTRQVGFDPWNTQQLAEQLGMAGFDAIQIQQNRFKLHEPLKLFLELIEKGKIRHNGDKLLRWTAGNLVINSDSQDRWMPDRKNSSEKIDPIVATIMALKIASLEPPKFKGSLVL